MPNRDEDDNKGLSFHPYTLWLEVRFKLIILLLIIVIMIFLNQLLQKDALPKYSAVAVVIKHEKNMGYSQKIPYLYLQLDTNTVIGTFLVEKNIRLAAKRLGERYNAEALFGKVKVESVGRSAIINVKATWHSAQGAADIANTISEVFLESYQKIQNSSAEKIKKYYEKEYERAKKSLGGSNKKLDTFKSKNNVYSYKNKVESLYEKRTDLEIQLVKIRLFKTEMTENVRGVSDKLRSLPETVILTTLKRSSDNQRLIVLKDDLSSMKNRYTIENPKVQNLIKKVEMFEANMRAASNGSKDNASLQHTTGKNELYLEFEVQELKYQLALESATLKIKQLTSEINKINTELEKISNLTEQYDNFMILVESAKDTVKMMAKRLTETKISIAANTNDYDILERATAPSHSNLSLRTVLGVSGGIFFTLFSFIVIVIRAILSNTVKTNFEVERHLQANSFGALPDKTGVDIATFYNHFQIIFGSMSQQMNATENHLNLITGLGSGEGKSFIIRELTEAYSRREKKILIIETLYNQRKENKKYAINDALYSLDRRQQIHYINHSPLVDKGYFYFDQDTYLNIIDPERIAFFIKKMKQHYDMILWECFPPSKHLQLFTALSRYADTITLVAQSRITRRDDIDDLHSHLLSNDAGQLGVIVNHVNKNYL